MATPDKAKPASRKWKKRLLLALTLFVITILFAIRWFLPTHTIFGAIRETTAYDLNEARDDRLAVFLRKHLPTRVVQSPHFPDRFKNEPRYLQLGEHKMEWSIGPNAGWIYFCGITSNGGSVYGKWAFAPSLETNLASVAQLPAKFYTYTNSEVESIFGDGSTTNAIPVKRGQILFAKHADDPGCVYVLKLQEQNGNKLVVLYCIAKSNAASP